MTTAHTPAGWYPDGAGGERWWDGRVWSDHVRPVPGAVAAPPGPGAPGVLDGGSGGGSSGGGKVALIVLAVLLVVVVLVVGGLWLLTGLFDGDDASGDGLTLESDETGLLSDDAADDDVPDDDTTVGDIRDVDFGEITWQTSCVGREDNPTARSGAAESVELEPTPGGVVWQHENPLPVDGEPAVFPLYEVRIGEPLYGDATGNGADDAVFLSACSQEIATTTQIEAWTLREGQLVQLGGFFEVPADLVAIVDIAVGDGRVRIEAEDARNGGLVRTVDDWVPVGQLGWGRTEVSREVLQAAPDPDAIDPDDEPDDGSDDGSDQPADPDTDGDAGSGGEFADDSLPGVAFGDLGDAFMFAPRDDARDPIVATQSDLSIDLRVHPDGSRLDSIGAGDDFSDYLDAWSEELEAASQRDGVPIDEPLVQEVSRSGADRTALLAYDDADAATTVIVMVAEVDGTVVEATASLDAEDWDGTFRPDTETFFSTFTFDAAQLHQGLGG